MSQNVQLINQVFEISQKIEQEQLSAKFERNFTKIYNLLEEEGLHCINPLGEKYTESRTDCEASIAGKANHNMKITKVIKPIVYKQENGQMVLIQKGIVIVE
ncbi:hypothetical protein DBR32_05175 [Taibaiella sp. KBW10]|uniref:hypothetical protein n=1 Tax=Taibaiella sp. KBW10 TaxID=2153357 RepID=UPI000F58F698|nr:hypothetical protein [Taibaiella sp. KBW10]RQO31357.1 hypothetical protein DBR32_05175 [Taibaiella sp. KBW10]